MSSSAKLTLAIAGAALAMSAAGQTLDSIPILDTGEIRDDTENAVSTPMTDTARRGEVEWRIDPGDASYSLVRWHLDRRLLPASESLRIAGLANAFDGVLGSPPAEEPFAPLRDPPTYTPLRGDALGMVVELFPSPTRPGYHVLHLGLRGTARSADRTGTSFVIVVEATGNAIPQIREAIRQLADRLEVRDSLGLVARGARGRMVLEPTRLGDRDRIDRAIDAIDANGPPDLVAGLTTGYDLAAGLERERPVRLLLFSDGAGIGSTGDELFDSIRRQARAGITLSVIGFPGEVYDDPLLARLAHSGDGHYAVVDSPLAARGVFERFPDSLAVVARDVIGRIELDPDTVSRFRLLGGPPRPRSAEGEGHGRSLRAGDRATLLIELRLTGRQGPLGTVRVRYRSPDSSRQRSGNTVKQFEITLDRGPAALDSSNGLLTWIAATFGEKLGGSYWTREVSYGRLLDTFDRLDARRRIDPRTAELRYLVQQARRLTVRLGRSTPDLDAPNGSTGDAFDQLRVLE